MAVGSGNLEVLRPVVDLEELFEAIGGDEILTPIGDGLEELGLVVDLEDFFLPVNCNGFLTNAGSGLEELRLVGGGLE